MSSENAADGKLLVDYGAIFYVDQLANKFITPGLHTSRKSYGKYMLITVLLKHEMLRFAGVYLWPI